MVESKGNKKNQHVLDAFCMFISLKKKIVMKNIVSPGEFFFRCKITHTEILFVLKMCLPVLKEGSQDNMINWPVCSILAHQSCARIDIFVQYGLML